ncbi:hypothetical protein [Roseovarius sp. D0-M9]|uniref:hypothetical protein n=1 Tax=Roseovarius sp. D0-M9 TaxID=3127117 RepID=UPI003FA7AC8C
MRQTIGSFGLHDGHQIIDIGGAHLLPWVTELAHARLLAQARRRLRADAPIKRRQRTGHAVGKGEAHRLKLGREFGHD